MKANDSLAIGGHLLGAFALLFKFGNHVTSGRFRVELDCHRCHAVVLHFDTYDAFRHFVLRKIYVIITWRWQIVKTLHTHTYWKQYQLRLKKVYKYNQRWGRHVLFDMSKMIASRLNENMFIVFSLRTSWKSSWPHKRWQERPAGLKIKKIDTAFVEFF